MSVELTWTGASHAYRIQAACSWLVPFWAWPQVPQPLPAPGLELAGVDSALTRCGFSHGEAPLVVIVASRPNSAVVSRSVRVTVTSLVVVSSPSVARKRNTYSPGAVPVTRVVSAASSAKITPAPSGAETVSQP